jgi:UDP-glucose 4-epimerase
VAKEIHNRKNFLVSQELERREEKVKVFVTGGAGYIGSITSYLLVDRGFEVVIYDDLSTGNIKSIPRDAKFIHGDILDSKETLRAMRGCDAIIHFAGRALVGESFAKAIEYETINCGGSNNLFDAAVESGIEKIVVASSCAVYGDKYLFPISESEIANPVNPYGASKLQMDKLLGQKILDHPSIGGISLRFFNVAGALKVGDLWIGENHDPETHVIPNIMRANSRNPFQVFGNDYETPDGTSIRDYVHVVDIAEAHVLALDKIVSGRHELVNLGTSSGYSLMQLIKVFNKVFETNLPFEICERRIGDPDFLVADNHKAKNFLNWRPQFSIENMMCDHRDFLLHGI